MIRKLLILSGAPADTAELCAAYLTLTRFAQTVALAVVGLFLMSALTVALG